MNANDLPAQAGQAADLDWAEARAEQDATSPQPVASDLLTPLLLGATHGFGVGVGVGVGVDKATPDGQQACAAEPIHGVIVGELVALTDEGVTALVLYPGQPGSAAIKARTTIDLHAAHIGHPVVLMFEQADPSRPLVMGVVRGQAGWPLADPPAQVQVDADGQRMVVNASEQLVLRCGKASITLTKAGKVLIEGSYLLSKSSGVNRVKGGSVQLN